jgi:hypothetical protein
VLLLGAAFGVHRIVDPDLFLHVAVGRSLLNDPRSLGISTFIEAYPGYAYVEDKWLPSVVVAVLDALGGENGLMVYQVSLCIVVAGAWYWMLRNWRASPTAAVLGVALALPASSIRLEPRPDTMSHALLAIVIGLAAGNAPFRTLVWLIPLVMAVWINVHGYFVNGLLILGATATCVSASTLLNGRVEQGRLSARQWWIILSLAAGACLLHPQGWHALANPIQQIRALYGDPNFRLSIQEFSPSTDLLANFGAYRYLLLAVTAIAVAALSAAPATVSPWMRQIATAAMVLPWLIAPPSGLVAIPYRVTFVLLVLASCEVPSEIRQGKLLAPAILIGCAILAAPMVRNLVLIPPAALIILAPAWSAGIGGILRATQTRRRVAVGILAAVVLGVGWLRLSDRLTGGVRAPGLTGWGVDRNRFPDGAVQFLEAHRLAGPVFNNFDVGGYLLYRVHPRRKVFIAGNTSMYPLAFFLEYRDDLFNQPASVLHERYGINAIVIDLGSTATQGFVARLAATSEWALVFLNRAGAVFVHVDGDTRALAQRYQVDLSRRVAELVDQDNSTPAIPWWIGGQRSPYPSFNLGAFLFAFGRPDLTLREAIRLWDTAPTEELAVLEGIAARQAQQLASDLPRLDRALSRYPTSESLKSLVALGFALRADERLNAGAWKDAESDLLRTIALTPRSCGPYAGLAKIAMLGGNEAKAREFLAESKRRDTDSSCLRMLRMDPQLAPLVVE